MSEQKELFENYCLDKLKEEDIEYPIRYRVDEDTVRFVGYKFAFRDKLKGNECYILFNEDNDEDRYFTYIPVDEVSEDKIIFINDKLPVRTVKSMTIYEYASILSFEDIYNSIKKDIDKNWDDLSMDDLITEGVSG